MKEPSEADIRATAEYANKILDALNLTPPERQYAENIGKVLAAEAMKELRCYATQGKPLLRPLSMPASLAYALAISDQTVVAFNAAKMQ